MRADKEIYNNVPKKPGKAVGNKKVAKKDMGVFEQRLKVKKGKK